MTAKITMTARERYLETVLFGNPDKIPLTPGSPRKSTLEAWHKQGLGKNENWRQALYREIGLKYEDTKEQVLPGIDFRMMPVFEEKVLEHKDGHYVVQDWMGNVVEISDEFDYSYIRNAIDFVTRKWLKFPVTCSEDFEKNMKWRYRPEQAGRFPDDFKERCQRMRERDYIVRVHVSGPFWQLREWCGFEPLCLMFIEQPLFIEEMVEFWTEFVLQTLRPVLAAGVVDVVGISEDMAYKEKSMISPAMTREFLQPTYERWVGEIRQAGVQVIDMDSDGRIDQLIPIWIESGINMCDPIEVAAGCDINEYRKTFGQTMAYSGGVDKRAMAKGGRIIEEELTRIAPVIKDGGYIPGCDHGVPPDISWPDFVYYTRLLAELTGWL